MLLCTAVNYPKPNAFIHGTQAMMENADKTYSSTAFGWFFCLKNHLIPLVFNAHIAHIAHTASAIVSISIESA